MKKVTWYGDGEKPKHPFAGGSHGNTGSSGSAGGSGKSATIRIGSVSSGRTASVTNSGTQNDAVFDFVLPKGEDGTQGIQGIQGIQGQDGLSAYEIAQRNGYQGSQSEWLKSLKGERGEQGVKGNDGQSADISVIEELRREIDALRAEKNLGGGSSGQAYAEIQEGYYSREELIKFNGNQVLANNKFITVSWPKPFSKMPHSLITLDVRSASARIAYIQNITETGFDIALNYAPDLQGVWYRGFVK